MDGAVPGKWGAMADAGEITAGVAPGTGAAELVPLAELPIRLESIDRPCDAVDSDSTPAAGERLTSGVIRA